MISWPRDIVDALARGRCIIFMGAGVSMNAENAAGLRPPDWRAFLSSAVEKCEGQCRHIKSLIRAGDLLTACELIKNRLDHKWRDVLKDTFVTPKYRPAQIHKHLYRLNARLYMTPNFDKVFDSYAIQISGGTTVVKHYSDPDVAVVARSADQFILKVHGTVDPPDQMIFTRQECARARIIHSAFYGVFDALLLTRMFIFVGAGLGDPDLILLLERHAFSYPGVPPHYILLAKPIANDLELSIRRNFNLKVISYSSREGHRELTESLAALADLVETSRQ